MTTTFTAHSPDARPSLRADFERQIVIPGTILLNLDTTANKWFNRGPIADMMWLGITPDMFLHIDVGSGTSDPEVMQVELAGYNYRPTQVVHRINSNAKLDEGYFGNLPMVGDSLHCRMGNNERVVLGPNLSNRLDQDSSSIPVSITYKEGYLKLITDRNPNSGYHSKGFGGETLAQIPNIYIIRTNLIHEPVMVIIAEPEGNDQDSAAKLTFVRIGYDLTPVLDNWQVGIIAGI